MRQLLHCCVFAGAGGTCTGVRACGGYRSVFAVELGQHRVKSLRNNHHNLPVLHRDVTQLDTADLTALLPRSAGRSRPVDLLTASPPCESFSSSRNRPRSEADVRDLLYRHALRIAVAVRARVMLWENVQEFPKKETDEGSGTLVIDLVRRDVEAAGYHILYEGLLYAQDFGLPQRRPRYWILASRERLQPVLPRQTTADRRVTVGKALAGLPADPGLGRYTDETSRYADMLRNRTEWPLDSDHNGLLDHVASDHSGAVRERCRLLKQGQGMEDLLKRYDPAIQAEMRDAGVLPLVDFKQRYRRLDNESVSRTVLGKGSEMFIHPTVPRGLTNRELARIQGFPDHHSFAGGKQEVSEQIGDAVPPIWARAWGEAIREMLG